MVKEQTPTERIESVKRGLSDLTEILAAVESTETASEPARIKVQREALAKVKSKCRQLADMTKEWIRFKQEGRAALPEEGRVLFDEMQEICASVGLFINPRGELESMLLDHGITWATDKKAWILQALTLLPGLIVDEQKDPFKFVKAVHDQLLSIGRGKHVAESEPKC